MVLADLGRRLNNALSALNRAPVVDEKAGVGLGARVIGPDHFLFAGVGCNIEGNHRSAAGIRCERQTRCNSATESKGESKVISGKQFFGQRERGQQEESRAEGPSSIVVSSVYRVVIHNVT